MDFHFKQSQNQNPHPSKPNSKRLTKDQARLLETSFISNQRLQAQRKLELAHKLGLSPRQVAIWYQNRRARCKTQTLELDYRTIQLKLDSALAEKTRLEKEVGMLKNELNKAQEMILLASRRSPNLPLVAALGDDDHASSSSLSNRNSACENAMVSQVEDLYVCFPDWLEEQLE